MQTQNLKGKNEQAPFQTNKKEYDIIEETAHNTKTKKQDPLGKNGTKRKA